MRDLLERARQQAEHADPSVRAAALLRIARVESAGAPSQARQTLLEGLDAVRKLPSSESDHLFDEARMVAAAVSPELLAEIPTNRHGRPEELVSRDVSALVQTMMKHGHADAAFDYVLRYNDPISFPFISVGAVLHRLGQNHPERAARRMMLLRHAVEQWRESLSDRRSSARHFMEDPLGFVHLFGQFWKDFPQEEALAIAHTIVDRSAEEPDAGTSCGYPDGIHFSSPRQHMLFQVLHVLRHLDPALAQSLVNSHEQLAAATRRYPNGLETMHEEVEAETERRKAEGVTCGGGSGEAWGFVGDLKDYDREHERHRRLAEAARNGDFQTLIDDALETYKEDTSPTTRNYASKEYWPSTGALRTALYKAGLRLGSEAATLLEQIPDNDLRLFGTIELAAALAGLAPSSITTMKRPHPPGSRATQCRIIAATNSAGTQRAKPHGPAMRSPDGRLIRCPKCLFQPSGDIRWNCRCGHAWNTFETGGKCPACRFQWEETVCPYCGEMSEHGAWYLSEP
jgi:hypothetical protein